MHLRAFLQHLHLHFQQFPPNVPTCSNPDRNPTTWKADSCAKLSTGHIKSSNDTADQQIGWLGWDLASGSPPNACALAHFTACAVSGGGRRFSGNGAETFLPLHLELIIRVG